MLRMVLVSLFALFIACQAQNEPVYYQGQSEAILDSLLVHTSNEILSVAEKLMGKPYAAKTLEVEGDERLVVDFTGFDCVTFVEYCIALKESNRKKQRFLDTLRNLRYRNGTINGYLSRLHYFTEWIKNAEEIGLIKDVTGELGGLKYSPEVSFMTVHPQKYPKLGDNQAQLNSLIRIERRINAYNLNYIPDSLVSEKASQILEGDIIAIVTSIKGLDFTHVGFAKKEGGRTKFLHTSSQFGEIMVTNKPLSEYLQAHKHMKGIVVLRLN